MTETAWRLDMDGLSAQIQKGEFHEGTRVTEIMKKYAGLYTPLIETQETPARDLPGLTCSLSTSQE